MSHIPVGVGHTTVTTNRSRECPRQLSSATRVRQEQGVPTRTAERVQSECRASAERVQSECRASAATYCYILLLQTSVILDFVILS